MECRWMWTIGEAACEGIVIMMAPTQSRTAGISCSVLRINGMLREMLIPSEAVTARTAAEKTSHVPLMRW